MSLARPLFSATIRNPLSWMPGQVMVPFSILNDQLAELAKVTAECEIKCFTSVARASALAKVSAIRESIDPTAIPEWKKNSLLAMTGVASLRIREISPARVLERLLSRDLSLTELEELLKSADEDDKVPKSLVEQLAVKVAHGNGMNIEKLRIASISLCHGELQKGYSSFCMLMATFIKKFPTWIIQKWDEQCASKIYNEALRKCEVYSLRDLKAKFDAATLYLHAPDYTWEKEAAIASVIAWRALLSRGHGQAADLKVGRAILSTVDLTPALLQQRRHLRLLVPQVRTRLTEEQLMRLMASDMMKVPEGVEPRLWQLVMVESALAAFKLSWKGCDDSAVDSVIERVHRSSLSMVDRFLSELEQGHIAEMGAIDTMLRGALSGLSVAVSPRTIQSYSTISGAHQHDSRFKDLIAELRQILDSRENIGKCLAKIHACTQLDRKLRVVDAELSASQGEYTAAVEALIGNLALWKRRLMSPTHCKEDERYHAEVKRLIIKHRWAFLAQREELGLPELTVNEMNSSVMDRVVRFVGDSVKGGSGMFRPRYYTGEEAHAVWTVSVFIAVITALGDRNDGNVALDIFRYLERALGQ